MTYIGVDCGVTGAISALYENPPSPMIANVIDIPVTERKTNIGKRHSYNESGICAVIENIVEVSRGDEILACIERVQAMPKNGSQAAFSSGECIGIFKGIFCAKKIKYEIVTPLQWKKATFPEKGIDYKDKNLSRKKAIQLFPSLKVFLSQVGNHNRAEALLIAEFIRKTRGS